MTIALQVVQGAVTVTGSGPNSTEQAGLVTGQQGTASITGITPGSYAWTVSGPPESSPTLSSATVAAPVITFEPNYPGDYLLTLNGTYTLPLSVAKVAANQYTGPVVPANITPGQVATPAAGTAISSDSTKVGSLLTTDINGHQAPIAIARSGNTASRPTSPTYGIYVGLQYFDTDLAKLIWWTGSAWVKADGTGA